MGTGLYVHAAPWNDHILPADSIWHQRVGEKKTRGKDKKKEVEYHHQISYTNGRDISEPPPNTIASKREALIRWL